MSSELTASESAAGWYVVRALTSAEWTPAILAALEHGPLHYTELFHRASSLHVAEQWRPRHEHLYESTLTRTLKQLTDDNVITRHEEAGAFPPSVSYSLTDAARDLLSALEPLVRWVDDHTELIEQARLRRLDSASGHE